MKMLVVTSCTGEKLYHPDNQLTQADFADAATLATREAELTEFKTTAGKIYTGMQHQRLMEGIETLRSAYGKDIVDLYIVSAGYGLISEDREVVPYEVTFNTLNGNAIKEWSQHLGIHHDLGELVQKYDLVLFLLGDKYLKAVGLPFDEAKGDQKLVFFASGTSKKMIPTHAPYYFVEVGQEDAKSISYGLVGLKGYLLKLMAMDAAKDDPALFEKIYADPSCTLSLLEKHRKIKQPTVHYEQLAFFPMEEAQSKKKVTKKVKVNPADIFIPETEYAANYTPHMKYFIPEWDDRVDPDYDFLTDTATEGRDPYSHDVYAHEIYPTPNYDGVLISKIIIEQNKTKKARIEEMGVHKFIRFDNGRPIMGDCGAFGYVDEEVPPFETKEILDYYQRLGFDIGVSIDHLIVGKYATDPAERDRRYTPDLNPDSTATRWSLVKPAWWQAAEIPRSFK